MTTNSVRVTAGIVIAAAALSNARVVAVRVNQSSPDQQPAATPVCLAIVLPDVEGVEGNAMDVATGVQQLFTSFLTGPSTQLLTLEARLRSQAVEEARQKQCDRILLTKITKKHGGGTFGRVLGDAASTAAWYMPGGATVGSTVARGAEIAGAQAVSTLAASTKAKDEIRLDYQLVGGDAKVRVGPKSDKAKAHVDGEDLLTPMVRRAAEVLIADIGKK